MATTAKQRRLIATALKQFDACEASMSEIRKDANDDDAFAAGNQWPDGIRNERTLDGRPSLVINKLPTFINKISNEIRQNRPEIKAKPTDDTVDKDLAQIVNGVLNHIVTNSEAETAYDTAVDHAVTHGFGYFRVLTDYCYEDSFDQEIKIDRIENSYSVYFPVHLCHNADWSDAPYCFVIKDFSREDFEAKYPNEKSAEWNVQSNGIPKWLTQDMVRVAEYFVVEETEATIYLLADGTVVETVPEGAQVVKERPTTKRKVKWYLITADSILDEKEFPVKYIPIIPVLGKEIIVDGKKNFISLTRWAKDPQRMYNFWRSSESEFIALAPKAPYIGVRGQFEGFETKWQTANKKPHAYLEYNPVTDGVGAMLPAPKRTDPAQIPSGYVNAAREASDDIKAVTGIFDASLGNQSNETSGKAINARQQQADVGNFHFADNLARALKSAGKIIVDLIPTIYDTPRIIRIVGEDKKDKVVKVNQQYTNEQGQQKFYDLSAGRYDIHVTTGPGYASRRDASVDAMLRFIQAFPQVGQIAGDLIAKKLDFDGSSELADRLRKTIPPQLLESDDNKDGPPPTEQLKAMAADFQKLQAENAELQGLVAKAAAEIQDKDKERAFEIDKILLTTGAQLEQTRITKDLTEANYAPALLLKEIQELKGLMAQQVSAMPQQQPQQNLPQGPQQPQAPMISPQQGAPQGPMPAPQMVPEEQAPTPEEGREQPME